MSYLQMIEGIPSFSKAVISLWFRAPKELVKAKANLPLVLVGGNPDFPIMYSVLPLITFGKPQRNKNYITDAPVDVGVAVDWPGPVTGYYMEVPGWTSKEEDFYDIDPCLIGLQCLSDGTFFVVFNIQTGVEMVTKATRFVTTKVKAWDSDKVPGPRYPARLGVEGWRDYYTQTEIEDASYADNDQPQYFHVEGLERFDPDVWHHLLLSFDVSGKVSIGQPFAASTCKMWYAIDDKDYRGQNHMGPLRGLSSGGGSNDDNLGDNTIITNTAWRLSGPEPTSGPPYWSPGDGFYYDAHLVEAPSGTYSGVSDDGLPIAIPTVHQPFGIPAAAKYVNGILRVELAEFQMWTGVTLDTGVETSRRAFIDFERDNDGKFTLDENGKKVMLPVSPGMAEVLLEKKPEILLHGSSDWIGGKNTGTTGLDYDSDPPTEKVDGQFVPVAGIKAYTPDPSFVPKDPPARLTRNARAATR